MAAGVPNSQNSPSVPDTPASDLFPALYGQLRELAGLVLQPNERQTLQPTALVHEAYMRLAEAKDATVRDRQHFLRLTAKVMRQILVDHARARQAAKRQPPQPSTTMVAVENVWSRELDVLELDSALKKLTELSPERAQLVELRFFAGLTSEEAADVLKISRTQAARWWRLTRAWLAQQLDGEATS